MKHLMMSAAILTGALLAAPSHAQDQDDADASEATEAPNWEGLWVAEQTFGPLLEGPVELHRSGDGWIARLQGETVTADRAEAANGSVSWSFSFLDQGGFEGTQASAAAPIQGHWYQPPGPIQYYWLASPVRLDPAGEGIFGGTVAPLPQQVSLNIPFIADPAAAADGPTEGTQKFRTFLRNPQGNYGVYFRIASATIDGAEIQFANPDGESMGAGNSVVAGEQFSLMFPRSGDVLSFTRRDRDEAPGFYPRRTPALPAPFPQPVKTGDGWDTASPAASGMDEKPLASLIGSIATFEPDSLRDPYIDAILIAHRGKLVLEEYFHGHHRDMTHDSRSAGKSLTSALLGIALRQGMLDSVDQPVYPLLGGVDAYANPDPRKERLTLRHLITMSPGLACDDSDYGSPGNEDIMQNQEEQLDWYRYTLDLPMINEPGEADVYCTGATNLVGGAIAKASGKSLPRFFQEEFAEPLGIANYYMNLSPTREGYMGGGIRLRPRDFLKLGQLYLNGGVWNGQRILSEEWVEQSAQAHSSMNETDDYGFAWWRRTYEVGGRSIETFYASGNGGQLLFVVPELELVVQINAANYSDGQTRDEFRDRFMRETILPAALASE